MAVGAIDEMCPVYEKLRVSVTIADKDANAKMRLDWGLARLTRWLQQRFGN